MSATRPVECIDRPVIHPFVCIQCGSQDKPYFVDLGIDVPEDLFAPLWDGALYFCCECIENLVNDINRARLRWEENHGTTNDNGGNPDDPTEVGIVDGESNSIHENVGISDSIESQSEPLVAATLDSSFFFGRGI